MALGVALRPLHKDSTGIDRKISNDWLTFYNNTTSDFSTSASPGMMLKGISGQASGEALFDIQDSNASSLFKVGGTGAVTAGSTLGVTGAVTLSSTLGVTGAATLSSTLALTGAATLSSYMDMAAIADPTAPSDGKGRLHVRTVSTKEELFFVSDGGEVQITSAGSLNTGELAGLTGTTSDSFTVNSDATDANADLVLGRTTGGNATLRWNGTTGSFDKAMSFSSTLGVTGAATLSSTLGVTGAATLSSTLGVTGAATLSSTLAVTGASTMTGAVYANGGLDRSSAAALAIGGTNASAVDISKTGTATTIKGTFNVDEAATFDTTVGVTGATTLSSTLAVTGAATLSSTLGVTGAATLSSTLAVTGASTFTGATAHNGGLTGTTGSFSSTLGVTGVATFSSDVSIAGNLILSDSTQVTNLSSEQVLVGDNHLYLNHGYTTASAQTGGLAVNYLPTSTTTTVAASGYTAGVASTSNPTVITVGSATFSASDIIQISGCSEPNNNGLFEVLTHSGTTLTIRGIGTTACVEDFTQNQFTALASASGTITKVTVAVIRADSGGRWETAAGATTGLSFVNLARVTESDAISFTSTLGVTGATTLSSTLAVTGAATLSSTLGVTGAATLSSTLGVTGAATLSSTLGVTGATTLSSTLAVTGVATFTTNILPAGAGTPNLGSTTAEWGNIYQADDKYCFFGGSQNGKIGYSSNLVSAVYAAASAGFAVVGSESGAGTGISLGANSAAFLAWGKASSATATGVAGISSLFDNSDGTALTSGVCSAFSATVEGHASDGSSSNYYGLTCASPTANGGSANFTGMRVQSGYGVGIAFEAALSTASISIPDNSATAFTIKEASNSYLTLVTTNASEAITLHKATTCSSTLTVTGAATLSSTLGVTGAATLSAGLTQSGGAVSLNSGTASIDLTASSGDIVLETSSTGSVELLASSNASSMVFFGKTFSNSTTSGGSNETIAQYDVVCATTVDADGVRGVLNTSAARSFVAGVAIESIAASASGVVAMGGLTKVNKVGSEQWNIGDLVYVSGTAGKATKTAPTAGGTFVALIGVCVEDEDSASTTARLVRLTDAPLTAN